ncbi:carboxypeptidase-like regulatory domain-containing protein [Parabacteroides sp. PF5-6]|uniref:carboxypeptidase-like regulatory domain-containing protein n=1 Tax=Parabacteroides sp. PF5-6 TaxID=1742403 RepID=UPI00240731BC|nr:carboxypeptidase-like regulatory domain-containing protein [Parabacteroides sp. PF5-6]MDF9828923.1 hypothetical protein [Parabacteroides sp. PF5-6]
MKKRLLYLILLSLPLQAVYAQVLKGVVIDSATKESVINANVYLEGTAYHTITDADGRFELPVKQRLNTKLIISHVVYETLIFANPFDQLPETMVMKEKENRFDEVVVDTDSPFSRKQMMQAFKREFLGTTNAGRACVIQNEEDIYFYYNKEKKTLHAFCHKPIVVNNKTLGYLVTVELNEFKAQYQAVTLLSSDIESVLYLGYMSFHDTSKGNASIKKKRRNTYLGSSTEFFRYLVRQQLNDSRYYMQPLNRPEEMFVVESIPLNDWQKKVTLHTDLLAYLDPHYATRKSPKAEIIVQNERVPSEVSNIRFLKLTFKADTYGNLEDARDVLVSGSMAHKRIGDTLPKEYEP